MRSLKTLIIVASALVMSAGSVLLAADDPLEIHGGGRVGIVTNGKLGAENGTGESNELGYMPNYGTSNYFGISLAKKVTSEGGAWARTSVYIDKWNSQIDGDLMDMEWRRRTFLVEFGGLDFLPAGSTLWGGLRGYGAGWNGQQDHAFINLAGIGFGIQNIGGVFSLAYMHQRPGDNKEYDGLGNKVTHNIIANVSVPLVDVYGAVGYSKKPKNNAATSEDKPDTTSLTVVGYDADGNTIFSTNPTDESVPTVNTTAGAKEKNYTALYLGGIVHAPVYGINLGAIYATNGYARETMADQRSDTSIRGSFSAGDEATVKGYKLNLFSLCAWTVTDVMPGLYTATSVRYDNVKGSSDSQFLTSNTAQVIHLSSRWSKALTKNIAFVGTLGFGREWAKKDGSGFTKKARTVYQLTPAVEIGLDTGYYASPKLQFYGTYTKVDSKHKLDVGAYTNKTSRLDFGMLATFGF